MAAIWDRLLGRRPTGAMSFSGRDDGNGFPVINWRPGDRDVIRVGGLPRSLSELYRTQPSVRICVGFLAQQMAHLKLKTYQRTDEAPHYLREGDHPLASLLDEPNTFTSGFDLIRDTVADIAIYDTAYWLKRFAGNDPSAPGANLFLFRIPPAFVAPYGGTFLSRPTEYRVNLGNGQGTFEFGPEEIVDFSGYHPLDNNCGLSPLESLKFVLSEELAMAQHRTGYWANGARREGVIERPLEAPELDNEGLARLQEAFTGRTAGPNNAGKAAILEEGSHWVETSFSAKDSEYIAGREFSLDVVATVYNIPLAVLSRKNTATFASMREFRKMLYVDTLGPWSARIEKTVDQQLVKDFNDPDLFVEFNIEEKLQGDFEESAAAIRQHVQVPDMSVNGSRKIQNLEPFGDPNDPENVFNWPARPSNYEYGTDPAAPSGSQTQGQGLQSVPAPTDQVAALEMLLEESYE